MNGASYKGFPSSVYDHGAAQFYREQAAKQAHDSHVARVELGLFKMLDGERFGSEDEMRFAVVGLLETLGHVMDDQFAGVVREAVGLLWKSGRYLAATKAA